MRDCKNKYQNYLLFMNSWNDNYKDILGDDSEIRFPFSEELPFNQINSGYSIIFKWFVYMNVRDIISYIKNVFNPLKLLCFK